MAIVISGMGIVSALGCGIKPTLRALSKNISGIKKIEHLETKLSHFPSGEVKMSDNEMKKMLNLRIKDPITRTTLMGRIALKEAILASFLPKYSGLRIAFISGTTVGGMEKSERYYTDFLTNTNHKEYIATHDCGANTDSIAAVYEGKFHLMTTLSTACSSAANAIILGANLLKTHRADIVVAGGSECLSKFHINGFHTLKILDSDPCKPFDAQRNGINLGEGAAYIVLENERLAKERVMRPLCYLSGYANACDAYHQTASSPDGEGAYLAMCNALKMSNLQPEEISYINAHGTGTLNNDLSEGIAIERLFGKKVPYLSSTKAFTGHTTSAAGAIEAVISILALRYGFIPANLNWCTPMEELSFSPVNQLIKQNLKHVLSNSFGFGGNNSALVFSTTKKRNSLISK